MDPSFLLNNPQLKNVDSKKLEFLMEMAGKQKGGSPQEMAAALMAASGSAKKSGQQFNSAETDTIVDVLKQNMSENDRRKADMILSMMKNR